MVKQGYKRTEIGVIPEDWDTVLLKDVCKFIGGGTPSKRVSEYWDGNIPWVSSSDINDNDVRSININRYITEKAVAMSATQKCPKGTILVVSRVGVGKVALSDCEVCTSQDFTNIVPKDHVPLFLTYTLVPIMQGKANEAQGTSIKGVTAESIKQTVVLFPERSEQERIAEALSDVDNMISSLEKLITKKKAVKQGAMQELLTGKKRLPGFCGEWETYKLDDLLRYEQPTKYIVHSSEYTEQGTPVLTAGKSLVLGYTVETDGVYEDLPVIIFDDFVTSSKYITYRFKVKSSAMKMLTPKKQGMNLKLIYEMMQMIDFTPVDHQRHWISQYSQFEIKLPSTAEEQNAIAAVLTDMDKEIEVLVQKLDKTRRLKQGMMEQLLTGRIRLA